MGKPPHQGRAKADPQESPRVQQGLRRGGQGPLRFSRSRSRRTQTQTPQRMVGMERTDHPGSRGGERRPGYRGDCRGDRGGNRGDYAMRIDWAVVTVVFPVLLQFSQEFILLLACISAPLFAWVSYTLGYATQCRVWDACMSIK